LYELFGLDKLIINLIKYMKYNGKKFIFWTLIFKIGNIILPHIISLFDWAKLKKKKKKKKKHSRFFNNTYLNISPYTFKSSSFSPSSSYYPFPYPNSKSTNPHFKKNKTTLLKNGHVNLVPHYSLQKILLVSQKII